MSRERYSSWQKTVLAARIWMLAVRTRLATKRRPLPDVVAELDRTGHRASAEATHPVHLGRIVVRVLTLGPLEARCLTRCLVHYQLLREAGYEPQLVIGLPETPEDTEAHSWLELGGRDIGPPPGRGSHIELGRYGGP